MKPGIWCWAVAFRRRGRAYYRGFYDVGHGGRKKALAAAIAWRDRQLVRIRTLSKRESCQIVRSSNRSGVPGVHFLRPRNQPKGAWPAKVKLPGGKQITRTFAAQAYGNPGAFERAVAARKEMLKLIEDRPYLYHAVAKAFQLRTASSRRAAPSSEPHSTQTRSASE